MFSCAYKLKKQISILGRKYWDYIFCEILDSAAVQDCTKFPSFVTNVRLQLVRDINKGQAYVTSVMKNVLSN